MRTVLLAVIGIIVAGLVGAALFVDVIAPLPLVGPDVEALCVEAMQRSPSDLSFVPDRQEKVGDRDIKTVTWGELPLHGGEEVRVAGFLHVEFEWVALYPSRTALEEGQRAPWVRLNSLWPDEPYWHTRGPAISDRCAVVEGTYSGGPDARGGLFNGAIGELRRLDVWSTPHRPFITTPPPPPPPTRPVR